MNKQILQNILVFLERVQVTGRESLAWAEAYSTLQLELQNADAPSPQTAQQGS